MLDCVHLYSTTYFSGVLSVFKSPSDRLMKALLESYSITCFIYVAPSVKIHLNEASLQASNKLMFVSSW